MRQHKNSFRSCYTNKVILKHLLNSNHSVNIDNNEMIYKKNNANKRVVESILIQPFDNFDKKCNFNCDISIKQTLENFHNILVISHTIHHQSPDCKSCCHLHMHKSSF